MGVLGIRVHKHQGDIPLDTHEQVVKVMSNSAGKSADGLQLLGLLELRLKTLSFCNVA